MAHPISDAATCSLFNDPRSWSMKPASPTVAASALGSDARGTSTPAKAEWLGHSPSPINAYAGSPTSIKRFYSVHVLLHLTTHGQPSSALIMLAITRAFALATLVAAAAAQSCAVCPGRSSSDPAIIDASGQTMYLVAASNSGPGTPTFCGYGFLLPLVLTGQFTRFLRYNHDKTHNWPEVFCYYSVSCSVLTG